MFYPFSIPSNMSDSESTSSITDLHVVDSSSDEEDRNTEFTENRHEPMLEKAVLSEDIISSPNADIQKERTPGTNYPIKKSDRQLYLVHMAQNGKNRRKKFLISYNEIVTQDQKDTQDYLILSKLEMSMIIQLMHFSKVWLWLLSSFQ
ncbi:hypothetical protein CBL_10550 [Carabus blaptoides fortunei]